jgi:hypothetical protein
MMMAICPKFGTRGRGVAVGVTVGGRVAVGGTTVGGSGEEVDISVGTGDATLGGAEVAQAAKNISRYMPKTERRI